MKKLVIENVIADHWNKWLAVDEIDWDKAPFYYDMTLLSRTVKFDDGTWAVLKVCSGQTNLWTEMVWLDNAGNEIACSEPGFDTVEGVYKCSLGEKYDVEVVRQKWRVVYWEKRFASVDVEADDYARALAQVQDMVVSGDPAVSFDPEWGDCGYDSGGKVPEDET